MSESKYAAAVWERIVAYTTGVGIVGLVAYVVIRGEPFKDQNHAAMLRILLSMGLAIIGGVIPGFLRVDLSMKGVAIRAGGALALFVLTYFFTPQVLPQIKVADYPWATGMVVLNGDFERLSSPLPELRGEDRARALALRDEELKKLQLAHSHVFKFVQAEPLASLPSPKQLIRLRYYEAMAHYQVAAVAALRCDIPDLKKSELLPLVKIAQMEAEACVKAAEDGFLWCQNVLTYPMTEVRKIKDAPRDWTPDDYRSVRAWVQEGIDRDLEWYRGVARAILAYYGKYDVEASRSEIRRLGEAFPPGSKDSPLKVHIVHRLVTGQPCVGDLFEDEKESKSESGVLPGAILAGLDLPSFKTAPEPASTALISQQQGPCCR